MKTITVIHISRLYAIAVVCNPCTHIVYCPRKCEVSLFSTKAEWFARILQEGERVTFITCPEASSTLRKQGILTSRPPGTKPGEPLVAVNHTLGARTQLLRPPSKAASALPQWLPVVLGTFAAAELGSGFFDPNLPVLIAGGLAVAGTSYLGGSQLLIPRLKQLADSSVWYSDVDFSVTVYASVPCVPCIATASS